MAAAQSWPAFRLYLVCVILGFLVPIILAYSIVYTNGNVISLSHRSSKEYINELPRPPAGNGHQPQEHFEAIGIPGLDDIALHNLLPG